LAWERRQLPRPLEEFVKHLKLAQLFRGKAAHGRGCVETRLITCFVALLFSLWRFSLQVRDFAPNGAQFDRTGALAAGSDR